MKREKNYTPDWDNSYKWREFEWEEALKYSDHIASRYFRMLDRFGDLPDAEELIAKKLGEYNFFYFDDADDSDHWYEEFENIDEPEREEEFNIYDLEPGDSLYFESCPVYQKAKRMTLSWCNILASVLLPEDRFWGLKILFHLGKLLSYISLGIDDGTFEHINGNIIFAKRALQQINQILHEIESKGKEHSGYLPMFQTVTKHLLSNRDILVSYLLDCLKRQRNLGKT